MALFGHAGVVAPCPLLGDERTWLRRAARSESDPKRSSGCRASSMKLMVYQHRISGHRMAPHAGEARAAGHSTSRRKGDFARESFGAPVEAHLALQLASNHAVHHVRAEAMTRRWLDRLGNRH